MSLSKTMRALLIVTLTLSLAIGSIPGFSSATAKATGQTIVSLEFDDGTYTHLTAKSILESHGMKGTFYASSGRVGKSGFLTKEQLLSFQAAGHEVGGHTANHMDLATLSEAEQTKQIVNDKQALEALGLNVTNFSYPFGSFNETTKEIVEGAGYDTARTVGGIGCNRCRLAESIPAEDAYMTETTSSIKNTTTLANMQQMVINAESVGGGWLQLVMHVVDNSGDTYSIKPETLNSFLDWLQARQANGTVVKTVREAIGTSTPPVPVAPTANFSATPSSVVVGSSSLLTWSTANADSVLLDGASVPTSGTLLVAPNANTSYTLVVSGPGGTVTKTVTVEVVLPSLNLLTNASFEIDANGDGLADNWQANGWGTCTSQYTRVADSYSGSWAQRIDISAVSGGDQKIVSTMKDLTVAPTVVAGKTYNLNVWYKSNVFVRFVVYYRTSAGKWVWFSESNNIKASSTWSQVNWNTPVIPAGATNLSVGFMTKQVGWVVFDDIMLSQN